MQKLILIAILFMMLFLFACNESTVSPVPDNQINNEDYLTRHVWNLKSTNYGGGIITASRIKFEKDSTFNAMIDSVWYRGVWSSSKVKNENDSTKTDFIIKLDYGMQNPYFNSTYQIQELDAGKLTIELYSTTKTVTYVPEKIYTNELTVTGDITFDVTMTNPADKDLTNAKVCLIWVNPQDDESSVIYGIGEIDKQNLTYSIKVNESFPMSLFMYSSPKITGYFNVGYVAIMWGDDVKNGTVIKGDDLLGKKMGMLGNRSFVFIGGDYQIWNINTKMLQGDIKQGFNFCEGWYSNQQGVNDGWKPTPLLQKQYIKVVPQLKTDSFLFPNWS